MRYILFTILLTLLNMTVSQVSWANQHDTHTLLGSHGMVLINNEKTGLLASHLPLYVSPHNYQLIYKVEILHQDKLNELNADIITILPAHFDLSLLVNKQPLTITADVYNGHFERGGKRAFSTEITFIAPVLIEKIAENFTHQKTQFYSTTIDKTHSLVIHKIQQSPSFDAISVVNKSELLQIQDCNHPETLNQHSLVNHLKQCGIENWLYIESQDFAN